MKFSPIPIGEPDTISLVNIGNKRVFRAIPAAVVIVVVIVDGVVVQRAWEMTWIIANSLISIHLWKSY
jgi:hypothetical protein